MEKKIKIISKWIGSGSINIFGRPFSGKDTQGNNLTNLLHGRLIGGGEILRKYHDQEKLSEVMTQGEMVQSNFYFDIISPYFFDDMIIGKPLILNSVGHQFSEKINIADIANSSGHPIKAVIYLNISEEEVWSRFNESISNKSRIYRLDNNKESIQKRINIFNTKTLTVINSYDKHNMLITIDSSLPQDLVIENIINNLVTKSKD